MLFTIISGGDPFLLTDLFHTTVSTAFDRSHEKEADQFALNLLEEAKISPTAMASFFRKLNRESSLENNSKSPKIVSKRNKKQESLE